MGPISLFDGLLGLLLLWLAWSLLASKDLFKAVVLFMVFGLLMAMVWVRLKAPDIALAEAAVGAGLTGVLFLHATGFLTSRRRSPESPETPEGREERENG